MSNFATPRPEYDSPPVIEVVLSVQFEPLRDLKGVQLGLLWSKFREEFPRIEEHPPIAPMFESFEIPPREKLGLHLEMSEIPLFPRMWFLNASGTELIQVQQDRFVHNWRKTAEGQTYPRFEYIRERFKSELDVFTSFLDAEHVKGFTINQVEVTYINHIVAGEGWRNHSELHKIISPLSASYSDGFLNSIEDGNMAIRYRISDENTGAGTSLGRLYVEVQSAYRKNDQMPLFVLNLTARGKPIGDGVDGAFAFLNIGREWIVRGFTSVTTNEMHRVWRRTR
jgi:uncharacterized protein (TIGR04255 family)